MAKLRVIEVESDSDEPDFLSPPSSPADVGSSSQRNWLLDLQEMGFSESDAEDAIQAFERRRQVMTINTLVEFILRGRGVDEEEAPAVEDMDYMQQEVEEKEEELLDGLRTPVIEEELHDTIMGANGAGALSSQRQPDRRELQLLEWGYDPQLVTKALLHNAAHDPVERLVDWLEAYNLSSDAQAVPCERHEKVQVIADGPEGIIEGLRKLVPKRLRPDFEESILKHRCRDVVEALDMLQAMEEQEKINRSASSNMPRGRQGAAGELDSVDSDEDADEIADEIVDAYDLGFMEPPASDSDEEIVISSSLKKRKAGEKQGRFSFSTASRAKIKDKIHGKSGKTGFGVPGKPVIPRQLKEKSLEEPPFFYFENVAMAPKGEWEEMSRHLYGIEPEFVDSLYFTACRRPRGYIHNLPVEGRRLLIPQPPLTIQEFFPDRMGRHWPAWDRRVKLNCIDTKAACNKTVSRFLRRLVAAGDSIVVDEQLQKDLVNAFKKWNLVWTGPTQVVPMTPEEMEALLGFDQGHTRGIQCKADRYKGLGNSFQVNTVAYHLSVLKPLYPRGMNVISLFAGIGGAEVALHKNGIKINVLVSVEKEERVRLVVENWWEVTEQKGILVHDFHDVKHLTRDKMRVLVQRYGRFDLLIGGSPCNNLTGNNRRSRTGLQGEHSYMFHDYKRILSDLRELCANERR